MVGGTGNLLMAVLNSLLVVVEISGGNLVLVVLAV